MSVVEVIRIDNSVLDYMMTWDQLAVSENTPQPIEDKPPVSPGEQQAAAVTAVMDEQGEASEDKSWIRKMRHIMAFKAMPAANIKQLLGRMESLDVKQGDVVVKQGEAGDYYYVLTEGKAKVTRTIELATLEAGTSFGEEALIAESKRNATVTMLTDGNISRLAKSDFDALLKEPLMERVSADEARVKVAQGATWLDVRHAKEYHFRHLPKAVNIPLHELRMRLQELDKNSHYICYCSTGKRSSAAAFLLRQNGYNASVLNGGVQTMAKDLVKS
jgi:rhodanese-related sulfurtransferase